MKLHTANLASLPFAKTVWRCCEWPSNAGWREIVSNLTHPAGIPVWVKKDICVAMRNIGRVTAIGARLRRSRGARPIGSDGGCLKGIRPVSCGVATSLRYGLVVVRGVDGPPLERIGAAIIPRECDAQRKKTGRWLAAFSTAGNDIPVSLSQDPPRLLSYRLFVSLSDAD